MSPESFFTDVFEMLRSMRNHALRTGDGFVPCDDTGILGTDLRFSQAPTVGFAAVRALPDTGPEDPSQPRVWRISLQDLMGSLKSRGESFESSLVRSCFKSAAGRRLLCRAVGSENAQA
jgi:hypothetical protein